MSPLKPRQNVRSDADTTNSTQRSSRRPSVVSDIRLAHPTDDVGTSLEASSFRKTNVSRPRSSRPPRDGLPAARAQSTQRRRLPEDGDKSSSSNRPKSLLRRRPSETEDHSAMLQGTEIKRNTHRQVATDDESPKRSMRPKSTRRCRSAEDESSSPLRTMRPKSESSTPSVHGTASPRRSQQTSTSHDRLLYSSPNAAVTKRKDSIHQNQRPKTDATNTNSNAPINRERTKSGSRATKSQEEEHIPEKQHRRPSTAVPKSNGTDRRRRGSNGDITDLIHPDNKSVNRDKRRSEVKSIRPSDAPTKHDKNSNASENNDERRRSRIPLKQGRSEESTKPRRGDVRKNKSSPDDHHQENVEAITKSKSTRKNPSEREERMVQKRSLVRKPSMQAQEGRAVDSIFDIGNSSSSHNSIVSAVVIQFDPTQQNGVVEIAPNEVVVEHQEKKGVSRTLVRKPSLQIPSVDVNELERFSDSFEPPPERSLVRKPSMMDQMKEPHDADDDCSNGSSSASTVIQFDPTHQTGVAHVDPNDIDDCMSIASFGETASVMPYDMENSWAAPVLAFHDSDGEELEEKPVSRRHNSSTKLLNTIQRRPSCGDSVHTKSSESHTTSSSFGRPQYYAPPLRNPSNTANALAATFAEFIEKDQSIDELNPKKSVTKTASSNRPVQGKAKKKKRIGGTKMDADDEKSQVGTRSKPIRPKLKKEVSNDRKKSSFDDVPVLRQMLNTSNHSTHSLLASDSDDDSYDDDRRMSNAFKPTALNNIVNNNPMHMTAYESETENDPSSTKKGKGTGIGKYFFGGGSTHSRSIRPKRDTTTTVDESDASDSDYSCSSVRSSSSRRSGVFSAATRRLMKGSNRHALLGDGEIENDVVPFSW